MFSIRIDSKTEIANFLKVNKLDFIDVLLRGDLCILVTNSHEAFTSIVIPANKSADQGDFEFRIHANLLASVRDEESIEVMELDGNVCIKLLGVDGQLLYKGVVKQQLVPTNAYVDRVKVAISDLSSLPVFDSNCFEGLDKIAKFNKSLINVEHGVAAVTLFNGIRAYKKVDVNIGFAMTSEALMQLRVCNSLFNSVEDLLVAKNGRLTVAVKKARMTSNSEFELIASDKYGSKAICQLNLGNIFSFVARMKYKLEEVVLDLQKQECQINAYSTDFNVPFYIQGWRAMEGFSDWSLSIPTNVITSILTFTNSNEFTLKIKKNYIQFEANDFYIVM